MFASIRFAIATCMGAALYGPAPTMAQLVGTGMQSFEVVTGVDEAPRRGQRATPWYVTDSRNSRDELRLVSFSAKPGGEGMPLNQFSNTCFTPITYCYLPRPAPIGSPCWCATPSGPSGGYVR